jgi:hypothetical protein
MLVTVLTLYLILRRLGLKVKMFPRRSCDRKKWAGGGNPAASRPKQTGEPCGSTVAVGLATQRRGDANYFNHGWTRMDADSIAAIEWQRGRRRVKIFCAARKLASRFVIHPRSAIVES